MNIIQWNSVAVGSPTAAGVIGTGNFPNLNAYLTSAGLATTAAPAWTEGQPATFSFDRTGNLRIAGNISAPLGTSPFRILRPSIRRRAQFGVAARRASLGIRS